MSNVAGGCWAFARGTAIQIGFDKDRLIINNDTSQKENP
jgi:hypothetical protein